MKRLNLELQANEVMLSKVDGMMANIISKAPYCPNSATGKAEVVFDNDPKAELRQRIAYLKEQIAEREE